MKSRRWLTSRERGSVTGFLVALVLMSLLFATALTVYLRSRPGPTSHLGAFTAAMARLADPEAAFFVAADLEGSEAGRAMWAALREKIDTGDGLASIRERLDRTFGPDFRAELFRQLRPQVAVFGRFDEAGGAGRVGSGPGVRGAAVVAVRDAAALESLFEDARRRSPGTLHAREVEGMTAYEWRAASGMYRPLVMLDGDHLLLADGEATLRALVERRRSAASAAGLGEREDFKMALGRLARHDALVAFLRPDRLPAGPLSDDVRAWKVGPLALGGGFSGPDRLEATAHLAVDFSLFGGIVAEVLNRSYGIEMTSLDHFPATTTAYLGFHVQPLVELVRLRAARDGDLAQMIDQFNALLSSRGLDLDGSFFDALGGEVALGLVGEVPGGAAGGATGFPGVADSIQPVVWFEVVDRSRIERELAKIGSVPRDGHPGSALGVVHYDWIGTALAVTLGTTPAALERLRHPANPLRSTPLLKQVLQGVPGQRPLALTYTDRSGLDRMWRELPPTVRGDSSVLMADQALSALYVAPDGLALRILWRGLTNQAPAGRSGQRDEGS